MEQGGLDTLAALCGGASKATTMTHNNPGAAPSAAPASPAPVDPPTTTAAGQRTAPARTAQPPASSPPAQPAPAPVQADASSQQQWQPFANAGYSGVPNHAATAAFASIIQAAVQNPAVFQQQPQVADPNSFNAMQQQVAYYQYLAAAQVQAQVQQQHQVKSAPAPAPMSQPTYTMDPNAAGAFGFPGHPGAHFQVAADTTKRVSPSQQPIQQAQQQQQPPQPLAMQQIIPGPSSAAAVPKPPSSGQSSMQPPPPPSQVPTVPSALSTNAIIVSSPQRPLAPTSSKIMSMKPPQTAIAQRPTIDGVSMTSAPRDEKKQQKRAANRRSAQLSRKRKKQFIEELKEENDELRRKEQILMSIPDLIVVFDSAGKLWFVSHSVGRFLEFSPRELEGTSFWDRLCEESVRLLKAAFMDALAARKNDMDTAPLGSGVWELRLVDKDGSHKVVTLNGVVHFSGDYPECVCSIRPRDDKASTELAPEVAASVEATTRESIANQNAVKPHQSVLAGSVNDDASARLARVKAMNPRALAAGANGRRAAQISDGDSGSVISESSSE